MGLLVPVVGLPRPLVEPALPILAGGTATVLWVKRGDDCYIAYALSGGP